LIPFRYENLGFPPRDPHVSVLIFHSGSNESLPPLSCECL
jgi:hypothetical protein